MGIVVFGASGRTGRQVVSKALSAGLRVKAIVRTPGSLDLGQDLPPDGLQVVVADVMNPQDIQQHIQQADAVASVLGARGNPRRGTTVSSDAIDSILEAMHQTGVRRLMVLGIADFGNAQDDGIVMRYLARPLVLAFLKGSLQDVRRMEAKVVASAVDWTIVRPPQLINQRSGSYRVNVGNTLPRSVFARRADVADYMVNNLEDLATFGQFVSIAK